jgi:hypothetical protein
VPGFAKAFAGRWRIGHSDFLELVEEAHLNEGKSDGEIALGAHRG